MNGRLLCNDGIGRVGCAGLLLLGLGGCGDGGGGGGGSVDAGGDPATVGSPIAWYRFDEEVTSDSGGAGHDATCGMECPQVVPGRVGSAASFDGTTYMRVEDEGALSTPEAFTVTAWVRMDELGGRVAVLTKKYGTGSGNSWALSVDDDGFPFCFTTADAGGSNALRANDPMETGVWHHMACSWDGSVKRFYVDGTEDRTAEVQSGFDRGPIVVGGDIDGDVSAEPTYLLDGLVDEAMIFDYALGPDEITTLAERGTSTSAASTSGDAGTAADGGE